jgi:hypothetical protein
MNVGIAFTKLSVAPFEVEAAPDDLADQPTGLAQNSVYFILTCPPFSVTVLPISSARLAFIVA